MTTPCFMPLLLRQHRVRIFSCLVSPQYVTMCSTPSKKELVVVADSAAKKKASSKQVRKIKTLHRENKALFGGLLETKQEKVKRTRQETKGMKQLTTEQANKKGQSKNTDDANEHLEISEPSLSSTKRVILPNVSSVILEHAGASINKNRPRRPLPAEKPARPRMGKAHKEAEVEWTLKAAPTKIKLIELSSSSSPIDDHDCPDGDRNTRQHVSLIEPGLKSTTTSLSSSLPVEDYIPSSSMHNGAASDVQNRVDPHDHFELPTVEQLIKGIYETDKSEQSMPLSSRQDQTDSKILLVPYLNPDRECSSSIDSTDPITCSPSQNSSIITSFAFPRAKYQDGNKIPVDNKTRLPSVSKILNATMPPKQAQALKRWEQKMIAEMGEEGFRLYKENILTNGKLLHGNIESYLRGTPMDQLTIAEPNQGHWNSLNAVLDQIGDIPSSVHVLESHVSHPKLDYCGVIDCVAEFRNRLVLIDWKTSQKPKPFVSMTYDTPLQIAAYIGAINYDPRYSITINDGLIVIAYEDGSSCQTFLLGQTELDKYWRLWLKRLNLFRIMNPSL